MQTSPTRSKRSNLGRPLAGSMALHGLALLAALWMFQPPGHAPGSRERPPKLLSVGLERGQSRDSRPAERTSRREAPRTRPMALGDLGVLPNYLRSRGQKAQHDDRPSEDGSGAKSPYGFESQLPTRASPVLTYLFHSIDQGVAYPAELFGAGISGEVSARLRFNDRGEWDEAASELPVTGRSARFFRVYLLGRLRRVLADPVPPNLWKTEPHALEIEARFVFDIVAPETVIGAQVGPQYAPSADPTRFSDKDTDGGQSIESQLIAGRQGMYERRFVFYRVHLASPLDWKLGPIAGYGLLPTIGIDPGWIADKIGDLWHHREKPDPLMKYRESPDW